MQIRNLENIDFDTLFIGFENAFSDYDIHFDKEEVRSMLTRRGFVPHLSFAAFDDDNIVAFTLNGIGTFNGIPTAYDTGTGTAKAFRGRGLARRIFKYSLPYLKEVGIKQYLLEVLQNNQKAISVYESLNFRKTREFDCYRQSVSEICNPTEIYSATDIHTGFISAEVVNEAQSFCDFNPSWQNSIESILRGREGLTCIGAYSGLDKLVGYAVCDTQTGDLTQIAVEQAYRRKGIGSVLLKEVARKLAVEFIKVLNVPADNVSLSHFLRSKNIPVHSKQFEMSLAIE